MAIGRNLRLNSIVLPTNSKTSIGRRESIEGLLSSTLAECGRVNMLVNCARVSFGQCLSRHHRRGLAAHNERGPHSTHWGCQVFGRHMATSGGGFDSQHRQRHFRPALVASVCLQCVEGRGRQPDAKRRPQRKTWACGVDTCKRYWPAAHRQCR